MKQTKAPDENLSEEWAAIPWRKLEQHLYHLQKRIFTASERGDLKTVHKLQKLLMRISVRSTPRSTTSDTGQPGQENRRDRWDKIHPTNRSTRHGRSSAPKTYERKEAKASQARVDTKTWKRGKTTAWNPSDV